MLKTCPHCDYEWEDDEGGSICPECNRYDDGYRFDPGSYEDHWKGDR